MTGPPPLYPVVADTLALALIASSNAPALLLDDGLSIVAVSDSFARAFDIDPAHAVGKTFADLGAGEWSARQLTSLLGAVLGGNAGIDAYEMDLVRPGRAARRLVLYARKLAYAASGSVRILLSVADVTEAKAAERLRDDMRRENGVLLQELQHRVANSLQIVASVLMQNARMVQSEETRGHLRDAHHRVMSVAAVQRQLTSSATGDVMLRTYFTDLCKSLSASMIHDPTQLSLKVTTDKSAVTADISVSLGLILTELVINALKHAFPDGRRGSIAVDYRSGDDGWTLSVGDDGVGMPKAAQDVKAGLGTSIVEALSKKLKANVVVSATHPGTKVSIVHTAESEGASDAGGVLEAV